MGFFDRLKKRAQDATASTPSSVPDASDEAPQAAAVSHAPQGPVFYWDGETYSQPPGWQGLSAQDWFYKLALLRDKLATADEMNLPHMTDEDGDALDPEEVFLIQEGFTSGGHFECFRNWGAASWAETTGESPTDIEFRLSGVAREKIMAEKAQAMSGPGGALEPVEGVSCEIWAHVNAAIASGGDLVQLIAQAGMDRPKWDRVSAEWMARMQCDASMAISTVYGNAFANSGHGQFGAQAGHAATAGVQGDLSVEPVPFERYCEIDAAMAAASGRGEDVNVLLQSTFGMSAMEWGQIGMFWSKKTQQEATKYHQLYCDYHEKYSAKYGG